MSLRKLKEQGRNYDECRLEFSMNFWKEQECQVQPQVEGLRWQPPEANTALPWVWLGSILRPQDSLILPIKQSGIEK